MRELDYLIEKAFCEGYEYAQREFNSPGITVQQAEEVLNELSKRLQRNEEQGRPARRLEDLMKAEIERRQRYNQRLDDLIKGTDSEDF